MLWKNHWTRKFCKAFYSDPALMKSGRCFMIRKLIALVSVILISGISLLLLWSMLGTVMMADSDAMDTAKALYEDGNYPEAIQVYEQILSTGVRDSRVLYNLRNAYAQDWDIGRAMPLAFLLLWLTICSLCFLQVGQYTLTLLGYFIYIDHRVDSGCFSPSNPSIIS